MRALVEPRLPAHQAIIFDRGHGSVMLRLGEKSGFDRLMNRRRRLLLPAQRAFSLNLGGGLGRCQLGKRR
jgi:hypothetical protein